MRSFVGITEAGQFELDRARWFCNSTIYFGRFPGNCHMDWFKGDRWERNAAEFDRDFGGMAGAGINHAAIFFNNDGFFDNGHVIQQGMDRMDQVVFAAKKAGVRISIFLVPFIDSSAVYRQITGMEWEYDDRWLPSFNPALHAAYVKQIAPFAQRYRNEPNVVAYTDRIDRFNKGFDNVTIPFNLKDQWVDWLKQRYGSFQTLIDAVGGTEALENRPIDFNQVLLPQESKHGASLRNPMAYDYILMQKQSIGDAQARFDAEIKALAPHQFVWTPFEANTTTWAMLDGFCPATKKLQAIWMEYYSFEISRPSFVQPFEEWAHTREIHHSRLSHQLPVVYNAAYAMCRYLKLSVQQPVVICHGAGQDVAAWGTETTEQMCAVMDRVNAACLAADGDGWHYWNWRDDESAWVAHQKERFENPTRYFFQGESMGLVDFNGFPKPTLSLVCQYSRELVRRAKANPPVKHSDVLLLSSAPRMYSLFRRLALPTAAAVSGALTRLGVEADYLWTAQDDVRIDGDILASYRLIVIADNMYERDFRDTPEKLLRYVENGGTLYFPLDRYDSFRDEHGLRHSCDALSKLSGVDTSSSGWKGWPGANDPPVIWPFPTDASQESNLDIQAFPRLAWGICPDFRAWTPCPERTQLLGFRSIDDDVFTPVPGLVSGAEVIAVGKFPAGTRPFIYRHRIGKGMVYVNAWTNNIFRDNEQRHDYGGWDYDWVLSLPLATSDARDVDLNKGASLWLRNSWGYFWKNI